MTTTTEAKLTTIGDVSYIMGPATIVIPGAKLIIGTRTYEVGELKRRGIVNGLETVAARYLRLSDSAPRSSVEWGDDAQDNTGYWASR